MNKIRLIVAFATVAIAGAAMASPGGDMNGGSIDRHHHHHHHHHGWHQVQPMPPPPPPPPPPTPAPPPPPPPPAPGNQCWHW